MGRLTQEEKDRLFKKMKGDEGRVHLSGMHRRQKERRNRILTLLLAKFIGFGLFVATVLGVAYAILLMAKSIFS